jgi:hypothetical protein
MKSSVSERKAPQRQEELKGAIWMLQFAALIAGGENGKRHDTVSFTSQRVCSFDM